MVFPRFDLTGQVALVTAAARGLGNAISLALAHAGADVALGLRDVNARGDLADQIGAMGRQAVPLQMDVRRSSSSSSSGSCRRRTSAATDRSEGSASEHSGCILLMFNGTPRSFWQWLQLNPTLCESFFGRAFSPNLASLCAYRPASGRTSDASFP
jgi:hypothetical protein